MQNLIRDTLQVIGKKYATDKCAHRFKGLTYLHIYDLYFRELRWRINPTNLLELGIKSGASLKMWRDYFGKKAWIVGVDKNPACKKIKALGKNIHIYIGLQDDKLFLNKMIGVEKCFNIIVDDASHTKSGTLKSFQILWKYVVSGGFYCIEDIKQMHEIIVPLVKYLDKRKDMKFLHLFPQLCIIGKV